jgi:hypothetical protein
LAGAVRTAVVAASRIVLSIHGPLKDAVRRS